MAFGSHYLPKGGAGQQTKPRAFPDTTACRLTSTFPARYVQLQNFFPSSTISIFFHLVFFCMFFSNYSPPP